MNTFWSIALDSDSRKTSTFEREWDILMNLLPQDLGNTHMGFFNRVLRDRERWARRYTWARMVAGMSASSRVEGLHGAVKGAIASGNKLQLCQVPVHIQAFVNKQEALGRQTEFNASQWSTSQQNAPPCLFLQVLNGVATPAAVKIVEKEWQKSMHYSITEVRDGSSSWPLAGAAPEKFSMWKVIPLQRLAAEETGEDTNDQFMQHDVLWERTKAGSSRHRLIVQVGSEAPQCTCQYQTAWGLPCRHLLAWQMFTCKTDEEACRQLVHSNSWLSRHWHVKTREDVKESMVSLESAAVLRVAEAFTAPDGEAPMDRASLIHLLKKCGDLAWDAGPRHREELARLSASFVKDVLQQGNLTQGNPWAGDPEVEDPVRGSGASVKRKKRPASGRPAGKTSKKGRGAIQEKVKCKACGKEISKNNFARHLKKCGAPR